MQKMPGVLELTMRNIKKGKIKEVELELSIETKTFILIYKI